MHAKKRSDILEIAVGAAFLGSAMLSIILGLLVLSSPAMAQPEPCDPIPYSISPVMGAWEVPVGHGINMVFGPADPACTTICWDTLSFHGWLNIIHEGGVDTVEVGPGDVGFWLGEYPEIGIEYHYPEDWPYGAEVHGGWAIATCDSEWADGSIYFHVEPDTTEPTEPDCDIVFMEATPSAGSGSVPPDANISMWFGPSDPACTTFCIDTSTFEGALFVGVPGMPPDTIYLDPDDVTWNYADWPIVEVIYDHHVDWPAGATINAGFHVSDCGDTRAHGNTYFSIGGGVEPDCSPEFVEVAPPMGAWEVPVGHGINMVFGPADPACTTICWDTTSFHGWLTVMHGGMADTVEIGPGDVEFWFGDYPQIGIEYHHPGDWPYGAMIHGGWVIATCDSILEDGNIYFHVLEDTIPSPDCEITFVEAIPEPGETVMDSAHPVTMIFGPFNPVCSTLCVDTASFEGIITMGFPGMMDTIYLDPGDVEFDFSVSPNVGITYTPEPSWSFGPSISARFAISDCDSNRANGLTHFLILSDSTSDTTTGDCDPLFIEVSPPTGATDVSVDHPITMVFGPADTLCTSMCWDTMSFEGALEISYAGIVETTAVYGGFSFADYPNITIEYDYPGGWPEGATVIGFWRIADCYGVFTGSGIHFQVEADSIVDCSPHFISSTPASWTHDVETDQPLIMTFGPLDPTCLTICWDTLSFHGGIIYMLSDSDSVAIGPADVEFDLSDNPRISIEYSPPEGWPVGEDIFAEWFIQDCDSNVTHGEVGFSIEDGVTFLTPLEYFCACSLQEVVFVVEPEIPPGLVVYVDWGFYVLGVDDELSISGDTITYTPATPWPDGVHVVEVGDIDDGRLEFTIDKTPPVSYAIYPFDGASVPAESTVISIHLGEPPTASGVDLESSTLQLFIDGVPAGTHNLDEPGIVFDEPILEIDLEILDPTLVLAPGNEVTIIFGMRDNVSSEYCGPNLNVWDLEYSIIDPATDTHILHGLIVDIDTDDPLENIVVQVFNYLGSPIPGLIDTTGPGGGYEIEVYPGVYTIGAFDPDMDYHPVFYRDRHDLLFADPIVVDSTSPSTVILDTLHMVPIPGGGAMFSVSGIITEAGDGPIEAAYVVAISSEDDEIESATITNPMGEYSLDLPDGEFIILAFRESYIPGFYGGGMFWASAETVVVAGAPIGGLDIELIPAMPGGGDFRIFGFVFSDSSARTVMTTAERGVRVYLLDAVTEQFVSASVSDNTGFYEFENLEAGTYRLIPDLVGYEPVSSGWDVVVSGSSEVNLTLVEYTNIPEKDLRAHDFELNGIAPNPFNSACAIRYNIVTPGEVRIEAYDVNGRLVETIENRSMSKGEYITVWQPDGISSGVYLVRIVHDGEGYSRRVLLIK